MTRANPKPNRHAANRHAPATSGPSKKPVAQPPASDSFTASLRRAAPLPSGSQEVQQSARQERAKRYPPEARQVFDSKEWCDWVAEGATHGAPEECLEALYLISHGHDAQAMLGHLAAQDPGGKLATILRSQPKAQAGKTTSAPDSRD